MKNLNKDHHSKFEKGWEEAFNGAEIEPSEDVWLKIDRTLANQESKGFRGALIFYKYAAAVSILLLLSTAVVSYYLFNLNVDLSKELSHKENAPKESVLNIDKNEKENSVKEEILNPSSLLEDSGIALREDNAIPEIHSNNSILESEKLNDQKYYSSTENINSSNDKKQGNSNDFHSDLDKESTILLSDSDDDTDGNKLPGPEHKVDDHIKNTTFFNASSLDFVSSRGYDPIDFEKTILQKEIFKVPVIYIKDNKTEKAQSSKGYFAGLQISPGYFDPNIQMNSNNQNSFLQSNRAAYANMGVNPSTQEQDLQPQLSYTYGLNFGLKMSKRWLLNLGVQYAKNNTTGTTNQYIDGGDNKLYLATPSSLSLDANESTSDVLFNGTKMTMNPIDLNNNFEFASIPVKAGFVVIDKKISWIISTGVATDFFIKSEIQSQEGTFEKNVIKPGESSPYRNLFFNGLASSEIIYHFNENYSISLEPSFRTALSSFSKSESMILSLPQTFGVAAGFRYNF